MADRHVVKDQFAGGSPANLQPASPATASDTLAGKSNLLQFRRKAGGDGPEPIDPTPHHGPRLLSGGVLECVAIDMANRWWNHETSIVTIRRKLNVSIPEAERIVRRGMKLRKEAA